MDEIWKDVVGYEGIYEVSNLGNIKSNYFNFPRLLKVRVGKDDCCRVNLWKEKKEKTWLVHRLVALAFLPTIEGKNFVNHKDGSRLKNSVDNLEWCNHAENNNHAFDTGLIATGHKVSLVHIENGTKHDFRSLTKASEFLDRHHGYVSAKLKEGITRLDVYEIVLIN